MLIGAGTQGLISAGFADRKWVLAIAGICGALAIVMLLLATKYFQTFLGLGAGYARVFTDTGRMYALGAVTMLIIFLLVRAKLPAERRVPIRAVLLCSGNGNRYIPRRKIYRRYAALAHGLLFIVRVGRSSLEIRDTNNARRVMS